MDMIIEIEKKTIEAERGVSTALRYSLSRSISGRKRTLPTCVMNNRKKEIPVT